MKKITIGSCSILALALATSGIAAAEKNTGVQPSAIEAAQRKQIDKQYAEQDLRLQQVDAELVTKGKYQDAIDIYRTVLMELEDVINKRNDWRARKRFDEITKRLRELEFVYGAEVLTKAEDAYFKKNYPEAIALAKSAGTICAALKERAEMLRVRAVYKQRGLEKGANMSGLVGNPKVVPNAKLIKKELAAAKTLLANGQYDEEWHCPYYVQSIDVESRTARTIANATHAVAYDGTLYLCYSATDWDTYETINTFFTYDVATATLSNQSFLKGDTVEIASNSVYMMEVNPKNGELYIGLAGNKFVSSGVIHRFEKDGTPIHRFDVQGPNPSQAAFVNYQ